MVLWRNKVLKSYFREIRKQQHIISIQKASLGSMWLAEGGGKEEDRFKN